MHAIRFSKEKSNQRENKEIIIQQEYKEATKLFVNDPNDSNISCLNEIKKKLECLMKKKQMELLYVRESPLAQAWRKKHKGPFESRKEKLCQKTYQKGANWRR